jgi:hypothetical protein
MSTGALERMTHELLARAVNEFGLFAVRYEITFHNDEEEPDPIVFAYENYWGVPDGSCLGWVKFDDEGVLEFKRTDYAKTNTAIGNFGGVR